MTLPKWDDLHAVPFLIATQQPSPAQNRSSCPFSPQKLYRCETLLPYLTDRLIQSASPERLPEALGRLSGKNQRPNSLDRFGAAKLTFRPCD